MHRREFVTLLGAAAASPRPVLAQQPARPLVAFLNSGSPDGYAPMVAAFRQGLRKLPVQRATSRADHQPQDRQGARHHRASDAARPCRRGDRMRRREFITLLGTSAAAWPLAA